MEIKKTFNGFAALKVKILALHRRVTGSRADESEIVAASDLGALKAEAGKIAPGLHSALIDERNLCGISEAVEAFETTPATAAPPTLTPTVAVSPSRPRTLTLDELEPIDQGSPEYAAWYAEKQAELAKLNPADAARSRLAANLRDLGIGAKGASRPASSVTKTGAILTARQRLAFNLNQLLRR